MVTPDTQTPPPPPSAQTYVVNDSQALQDALNKVQAGDTIIIRGGRHYRSNYRYPGETIRGFTLANSGTADAPIRIAGDTSDDSTAPIIDQGITSTDEDSVIGIYLLCASHVVIENLEIRNVHSSGISSSLGDCASSGIKISNTHIHHVYGDTNVGGIRLSRTSQVEISNNLLHDIYQSDRENTTPIVTADSDNISEIVIRQNHFSNSDTGVRLQAQNDNHLSGIMIQDNHFELLDKAVVGITNSLNGASSADSKISELQIQGNLFLETASAIDLDMGDTREQSQGLSVVNNTFHDIERIAVNLSGIIDIIIYNNIFSHVERDLLITRASSQLGISTNISEMDYNLFWHTDYTASTGPEWLLDLGGTNPQTFNNFSDWTSAFTDTLHAHLQSDPDQVSEFMDPLFSDSESLDFTPQSTFAINGGYHGETLGAFTDGKRPGPGNETP
ncbi:right-handed parallel beta-helix repeat-containing protein [Microbulbifer sp. 2205BS26-8]|uniref:right-handed parallel beta-helix repeat-containing protein n=1 Tax=Microbulbifer sp. 2205BS26-8 TaxID=3064386 RepID=UPI0027400718|nr:right-handed parallel beta-helix repeat-containing protein [Microbulbifer sp. 2205BS26-8]MDP5211171.1 right-handed parallel beta-helix repeat-containing protein [Microbulbifer sp. 2205BS26-8]